ncbi:MAG: 16S rRNA (uracil(1498)-N(3))-methyltransferase [Spirochaetes bacterium]|nr:16S rRNA (uracil(1498)-N(3))-methyltransferase [Spirochaetota bacterium]
MKHFLLPEDFKGEELTINRGREFHYLSHVLRLREGDTLKGIDRRGKLYRLIILTTNEQQIRLRPVELPDYSVGLSAVVPLHINLYQCIPKGKKMDLIIRQATEMGVTSIIPVISRYTVPVLETKKNPENKLKRWQRIAREAVQQSGSLKIPGIQKPISLKDICTTVPEKSPYSSGFDVFVFFHPESKYNTGLHRILCRDINSIGILIGPEGGFSEDETAMLRKAGMYSAFLGNTILRTETAAIYAIAAVKMIHSERNSWRLHEGLATEYKTS